ncbi:MAG TPA: hypothetical protein VE033_14450 [Acetobacteraceae bacterium]|jgi:hypothetical protein|nr:hypothetical protein [Acetobacteraceae bacterium]
MRRFLLPLLLLAPLSAGAQPAPPACNAAREGVTACLDGKLCTCRFERGGSITGRRDGHRWDCGTLRPQCGPEANVPAGPPVLPVPLPNLLLQMDPSGMPGQAPVPYPPHSGAPFPLR